MRRETRKHNKEESMYTNVLIYSIIGVAILIAIVIASIAYSNIQKGNNEIAKENASNEITVKTEEKTESASVKEGKSVNEAKNEMNNNIVTTMETNKTELNNKNKEVSKENVTNNVEVSTKNEVVEESPKEELSFIKPVDGEILNGFAKEQLYYSNTLEEWTNHLGIDIKAEKNSIVVASEAGIIKSIKNDPRYGITITIEHSDGYQTKYANLQNSESVVEGEKVEKGQNIGMVGNTASCEIKDESHLHFEILKDYEAVNPSELIK